MGFVDFLAKPSNQTYLFNGPSHYVCSHFLAALFSKFVFPSRYWKYVIVLGVSYGTWNSSLVTFLANKHDYTFKKQWLQEANSLDWKKKLVV